MGILNLPTVFFEGKCKLEWRAFLLNPTFESTMLFGLRTARDDNDHHLPAPGISLFPLIWAMRSGVKYGISSVSRDEIGLVGGCRNIGTAR